MHRRIEWIIVRLTAYIYYPGKTKQNKIEKNIEIKHKSNFQTGI